MSYQKKDYGLIFIQESTKVHNNKYDYSNVVYKNNRTKVRIVCNKHGDFYQTPDAHKRGQGCPKCGKESDKYFKYTFEEFKTKAEKVHGNKYEYYSDTFKGDKSKIKIYCKEHGEFYQHAYIHLRETSGCPRCINKKVTTDDFILKARKVHGQKYNYSKVDYKNNRTKIIISCEEHGVFLQTPNDHLAGYGCKECGTKKRAESKTKSHEEFVTHAIQKTGNVEAVYKYDVYKGEKHKFKFYCPKCNTKYEQSPRNHLNGDGCPICANQNRSRNWLRLYEESPIGKQQGYFYILKFKHKSKDIKFIKIGITKHTIEHRYKGIMYRDFDFEVLKLQQTTMLEAAQIEQDYLTKYKEHKFNFPKDIIFHGRTECFNESTPFIKKKR